MHMSIFKLWVVNETGTIKVPKIYDVRSVLNRHVASNACWFYDSTFCGAFFLYTSLRSKQPLIQRQLSNISYSKKQFVHKYQQKPLHNLLILF